MDKRISIKTIIEEIKTGDFLLGCGLPMGYADGFPILQVRNGKLCLLIPYLKYQTTGEVDKTLVYPIRYTVRLKLPEGNVAGFADLSCEPEFGMVDFSQPVGVFRHEAVRQYDRKEYMEKRNELMELYDKAVLAHLTGGELGGDDKTRMSELLDILVEPSLKPMYRALDREFYDKYFPSDTAAHMKKMPPERTSLSTVFGEILNELSASGQEPLADQMRQIYKEAKRDKFVVAVVGEFSRGKSTFLNKLLERELLPVGDMPTTAMVTRIRYGRKEEIAAFDEQGKKRGTFPLSPESWEGLTAENFGREDPAGAVVVTVDFPWLMENRIELMDTPGAGDLEDGRARAIGEALLGCDGAIIAVSAVAALSMSEKVFIEERLMARRMPFLMIILTKLDVVPVAERPKVIDYAITKLKSWKLDIPVLIPYTVEMPDGTYDAIMGLDNVKAMMGSWVNDPQRAALTERWIAARMTDAVNTAATSFRETRLLLEADQENRKKLMEEKKRRLSQAEIEWEDLRLTLLERCNACYSQLLRKVDEYKGSIVERLQYESAHTANPEKWWTEDYPYRLKMELANMAVGIENITSRTVLEDAGWFNAALDRQFQTHVLVRKETIADKDLFGGFSAGKVPEFENLDRQRMIARVGAAALSIAGCVVCSSLGFMPIIATMGIGTGTTVISDRIFKGKIEKQQAELKEVIAKNVPELIGCAMSESEVRLKTLYDDILNEAVKKEKSWMEAQRAALENSLPADPKGEKENLDRQITCLDHLVKKLCQI